MKRALICLALVMVAMYCFYNVFQIVCLNNNFELVFKTEICADNDFVSEADGHVVIKAGTTCEVGIYMIKVGNNVSAGQCFDFLKQKKAMMFGSYLSNKDFKEYLTYDYRIQRLMMFDEKKGYVPDFKLTSKLGDYVFDKDSFMVPCLNRCGSDLFIDTYSSSNTFEVLQIAMPAWPRGVAVLCVTEKTEGRWQ